MKIIKKLSILLILYQLSFSITFAQSTRSNASPSEKLESKSEINPSEKFESKNKTNITQKSKSDNLPKLVEDFYYISLGFQANLHGADFGLGFNLTSPMIMNTIAFYLDFSAFIFNYIVKTRRIYYTPYLYTEEEYKEYDFGQDVYGLLKLGLQISYTESIWRGYLKAGASMKDNWTWSKERKDWGVDTLLGFEMYLTSFGIFTEIGCNILFIDGGKVSQPNFEVIVGTKLYF